MRPFRYRTLGVFVDMGQGEAVASTLGIKWRGRPAWLMARSYHLVMMPGIKRKLRLLTDWNVQLLFGRDASELGTLGHSPSLGDEVTSGGTTAQETELNDWRKLNGGVSTMIFMIGWATSGGTTSQETERPATGSASPS